MSVELSHEDPCTTSYPTLIAWLEHDLSDEETRSIATHVEKCKACREKLELMDAVQEAMRD